jgi:aminopeptidase N
MQVKRRIDYHSPTFIIQDIDLTFDLCPEKTIVRNVMTVERTAANGTDELVLDGSELTLISIQVNGEELTEVVDYRIKDEKLTLFALPVCCELTIVTQINPKANTALEGLYYASDTFCTQCEAEGFRRITYYLDRPDVLSIFTVTINADKTLYPFLLSNGNTIAQGDLADNKHFMTWHDPFKKPAYLFALVAGDFDVLEDYYTTSSQREVALQVFVEKGRLHQAHHAMQSLKKSMRWDEETFDLEYDLDIYMVVAVDFFNMGAMENKGLNVFNSKFVLAESKSATDEDYFNIESIIAHEYFHNWTGNRVTCRDWFQLSLKEGLTVFRDQSFSHDMTSPLSNRIKQVNVMRSHQFAEDASAMSHPIRPDEVIEMNNFYTVTVYDKGAEVIRMMHTLLGDEGFKAGIKLYFDRHDGQAVTCDDFVLAMQDANDYDLTQFALWYSQAGTPEVTVSSSYDEPSRTLTLALRQETKPTASQNEKSPLVLPIKYDCIAADGTSFVANEDQGNGIVVMDKAQFTMTFTDVPADTVAVLFNGFSAPVKVQQSFTNQQLMQVVQCSGSDFAKWEAMQDLYTLAIDTLLSPDNVLNNSAHIDSVLQQQVPFIELSRWLNDNMSRPELMAELLSLPSTETLLQSLPGSDILAIEQAREALTIHLVELFEPVLLASYHYLSSTVAAYAYEQHQVNNRKLAGVILNLLVHKTTHQHLANEHFAHSNNMTDTLNGLKAAQISLAPEFNVMMDKFSADWQHDTVVMDKWFALHATAHRDDILSQLTLLQAHPIYSAQNPNKVRALMGSFAFYNVAGFHAVDGSGYAYITNYLMQLDSINAQVAARIVTPLTQWQMHTPKRQSQMVQQLRRLLDKRSLSKDLFEKVSKSVLQYEAQH